MRKRSLLCIVTGFAICTLALVASAQDHPIKVGVFDPITGVRIPLDPNVLPPAVLEVFERSVVLITSCRKEPGVACVSGTGFLYRAANGKKYVVTRYHNVVNPNSLYHNDKELGLIEVMAEVAGVWHAMKPIYGEADHDLMLLDIERPAVPKRWALMAVGKRKVLRGEAVAISPYPPQYLEGYSFGFSRDGIFYSYHGNAFGRIIPVDREAPRGATVVLAGVNAPGFSGSPIIDPSGKVFGMEDGANISAPGTLITPMGEIDAFVKRAFTREREKF